MGFALLYEVPDILIAQLAVTIFMLYVYTFRSFSQA